MRINFLLPHFKPSGGVNATMTFAHRLAEHGHQVTASIENRSIFRPLRSLWYHHPLVPRGSKLRVSMVKHFSDLPDADIWLGDSWKIARRLHALPASGLKFEYVQHDERMYHGDPERVAAIYRLPLIKIVNARWLREVMQRDFGYDAEVVGNAVDCTLFHPREVPRNDGMIRILLLHHDYAWKGTKEGVEIVQNLKQRYPNIKLILFGTRQKHIGYACDEYHYNMFGEKLAGLFRSCDIFLGPSWDEGLAFPPRWAMASGCALVTYDNGSSRDYAFDGTTALVAARKNQAELSRKLEQVIIDEPLRRRIAQAGLAYVRKMPTWGELTDKLEGIFAKALNHA